MKKHIMMASLLALGLHSAVNAQIKLSSVTTTVLTGGAVNTVILGDGTTTGTKNTYIGNGTASGTSASGNDNTFVGQGVAPNNTGNANTFIGKRSGEVNTGSYNAFLGENSGVANTTGYYNTYLGTRAGVFSETGYENTFIGLGAGWENKTGNRNTLLGTWANFGGINKDKLQYATAIGYNALVSISNAMSLGGLGNSIEAVKVGIGTDVPTADLHIEKSFNAEAVSIMSHSKRTDFYSSLNLRTGNSIVNDLILVRFGSTFGSKVGGAGNFFPAISGAGSCPAVSYDNFGMIAGKNGPLSIGTIENSAQNIHFFTGIRSISTGTSLKAWECLRINNANGFVGIHTRTATTGLGSGDPQALFHVNLTQPGQSDLVKHTQGIRFEGLPTYNPLNMPPHPDVIVVDAEGNLALQDKTTLGGGAGPDDWHTNGNSVTLPVPTEFIGTLNNGDFKIKTNGQPRARFTSSTGAGGTLKYGNFELGSGSTFLGSTDKSVAFGESNTIDNTNDVLTSGLGNSITASSNYSGIVGLNNKIDATSAAFVAGNSNEIKSSSNYSAAFGEGNIINGSENVLIGGKQNTITGSSAVFSSGTSNNINLNSNNSGALGELNTISGSARSISSGYQNSITTSSNNSGAIGDHNTIDGSLNAYAFGLNNVINNASSSTYSSNNSTAMGLNNNIVSSFGAFIAGSGNNIQDADGAGSIVMGAGHTMKTSHASLIAGEENHMEHGHGSFIAGGHSHSDGEYNAIIGQHVRTGPSTATLPIKNPTTYPNIMIMGNYIHSDLPNSLTVGFDQNRTTVTTNRGFAVQLDPNTTTAFNTYNPTVNFEVQASVSPTATAMTAIPPGSLRSNIRFHNLPTERDLPVVMVDPSTGELFRSTLPFKPVFIDDSNSYMMISDLKKSVEEQKTQIANQQKQIEALLAAVKVLSDAKQNETLAKINIELSDKDAIVLYQNIPNPCDKNTSIGFSIPASVQSAKLDFTTMDGKVIKSISISERGKGLINIYTSDLSSGIYLYSLIADGKLIDTKRIEIER